MRILMCHRALNNGSMTTRYIWFNIWRLRSTALNHPYALAGSITHMFGSDRVQVVIFLHVVRSVILGGQYSQPCHTCQKQRQLTSFIVDRLPSLARSFGVHGDFRASPYRAEVITIARSPYWYTYTFNLYCPIYLVGFRSSRLFLLSVFRWQTRYCSYSVSKIHASHSLNNYQTLVKRGLNVLYLGF